MLLVIAFAVFGLNQDGARSALLAWKARIPATPAAAARERPDDDHPAIRPAADDHPAKPGSAAESAETLLELPAPDQEGVIRLPSAGPYRAREIAVVGRLAIIGEAGAGAEILVRDKPLKLLAESLRMENIRLRRAAPTERTSRPPAALALIHAQSLDLDRCVILNAGDSPERLDGAASTATSTALGLAWKLIDPLDHQGGVARLANSVATGGDAALFVASPIRRVEFVNCLRLAGGPLCHLVLATDFRRETTVRLERTTCRGASALLRIAAPADGGTRQSVAVDADDCVFDLASPAGTLFELVGNQTPAGWGSCVRLTGEGSLAAETTMTAVAAPTEGGAPVPLDPAAIRVEGILTGPYRFAGPISRRGEDAEVRDYEAPRRSPTPPGVVAAELPQRWE
jgi:hypothetical protein